MLQSKQPASNSKAFLPEVLPLALRLEPTSLTPRVRGLDSTAQPLDTETHPTLSQLKTTGDSQPQSRRGIFKTRIFGAWLNSALS